MIAYRRPDVPRPPSALGRPAIRLLLAVYWVAQLLCVIWLLMCFAAMTAKVVELSGVGPPWPWQERAQQLVAATFAGLPAVALLFLLRYSRSARRSRRPRPRRG